MNKQEEFIINQLKEKYAKELYEVKRLITNVTAAFNYLKMEQSEIIEIEVEPTEQALFVAVIFKDFPPCPTHVHTGVCLYTSKKDKGVIEVKAKIKKKESLCPVCIII